MNYSWFRSCGAGNSIIGSGVLTAAALTLSGVSFQVTAGTPIQAAWMLLLGSSLTAVIPLYTRFPELDSAMPRRTIDRVMRIGITAAITTVTVGTTWLVLPGVVLVAWILVMTAVGILSCLVLGDRAWTLPLAGGGAAVLIDHNVLGSPISSALNELGVWRPAVLLLGIFVLFIWAGSSQSGRSPRSGYSHRNT